MSHHQEYQYVLRVSRPSTNEKDIMSIDEHCSTTEDCAKQSVENENDKVIDVL
jgi:hypothetical protein